MPGNQSIKNTSICIFYLLFILTQIQKFKNDENPTCTSKDTCKTIIIILFKLVDCFITIQILSCCIHFPLELSPLWDFQKGAYFVFFQSQKATTLLRVFGSHFYLLKLLPSG